MDRGGGPPRRAAGMAFAGSGGRRAVPQCRGSLAPDRTGGGNGVDMKGAAAGLAATARFFEACEAFEPK